MQMNAFITRFKLPATPVLGLAALLFSVAACNNAVEQQDAAAATTTEPEPMETSMFYVGTYAKPEEESIFLYSLNPETGELTRVAGFKGGENPSYLTLDDNAEHLYAVNETTNFEGKESGAVSAFAIGEEGKELTLLNQAPSGGGAPCHIWLSGGNTVLVANYVGGNVATLPVQADGQLGQPQVLQHEGTGPNKERQEKPHAHYIAPSPDGKYSFAVDLGADKVFGYRLEAGKLTPNNPAVAYTSAPGSGPRHMAFHPSGKYAYLLHELNSTVTVLEYDAAKGIFTEAQILTTLPEDVKGDNYPAAIKVSADGKFLYTSNRGHNSIAVFAVEQEGSQLKPLQHMSTGGDWPRDFSLDPSGSILLVANERSNNITAFKVDKATGKLSATGQEAQVQKPVNLVFR